MTPFCLVPVTLPPCPQPPAGGSVLHSDGLLWLSPFIAQPDVAYDSVGVAVFVLPR